MSSNRSPANPIVIVDDEPDVLASLTSILAADGMSNVLPLADSRLVIDAIDERGADLVLLDLSIPHYSGRDLLSDLRSRHPDVPVIVVTAASDVGTAVHCMKEGASDYLVKAIDKDRLIGSVRRALEIRELRRSYTELRARFLSDELTHPGAFESIITRNRKMRSIFLYVEAIARSAETVLITGETGVGKELIAEAIHTCSDRSGSFVRVNTAGLDDAMFSDSLFGHRRGAYTGATERRDGLVMQAGDGTVFLDEIGDMTPASQLKLLQLLERKEYYPGGSDLPRRTTARFVVATNQDLDERVRSGQFRRDLYYRLSTHPIYVPPLRERVEDIPLLLDHFLARACAEIGVSTVAVEPDVLSYLKHYAFPGNVRELRSIVFDAAARGAGSPLTVEAFQSAVKATVLPPTPAEEPEFLFGATLPTIRNAVERLIDEALARSEGNQAVAAGLLGISPQALSKRLKRRREADGD